jgi:K+-sensing histidine kinase KdpD
VILDYQAGLYEVILALAPQAVEWILREILENAKKFHPTHTPLIEIGVSQVSATIISLKIADNGLTLSPVQLSRVWTPYYQGEKYLTGEAAGMGLGLPIVASLLWEVGGTGQLYNRLEGPGVVVELMIPVKNGN